MTVPAAMERLLTRGEAADILNVSERTVRRLDAAGALPRVPQMGRTVRYSPEVLRAFATLNGHGRAEDDGDA